MVDQAPAQVALPPVVSVKELAEALGRPVTDVISTLMRNGVMATINEDVDFDTAAIIASDLDMEVVPAEETIASDTTNLEAGAMPVAEDPANLVARPPVVTVLGHVDHGKTSLLDRIRQTNVAGGESGGITQHIGAYQVPVTPRAGGEPRLVTFLDTPGHEAFSAMRAHGTRMTDVAILVVAADDGVMPQTREAVEHIKKGKVPFVVAVTKSDREGADANRVKQGLAELDVVPEDWGGEVVFIETSSVSGQGIPELLEMLLLVSDIARPRANPAGTFAGVVIESQLSRAKCAVATILVNNGTLKISDYVALEDVTGRIRLMEDYQGKRVTEAVPGMPVQVAGLSGVPSFGAAVEVAPDERTARQRASLTSRKSRARAIERSRLSADTIVEAARRGQIKQLPIVLVTDVKGSLEAIEGALANIPQDEVSVQLVQTSVGSITESDLRHAASSGATVVGFRSRVESSARPLAKQLDVTISMYTVIYELLGDIKAALEELLPPEIVTNEVGQGEVLAVFRTTKHNQIIGCKVTDRKFVPGVSYRLDDQEMTGQVTTLRRVDQEVGEVGAGTECGVTIEGPPAEVGQSITLFRTIERRRTLDSQS